MRSQRKNMTNSIRNTLEDMIFRGDLRSGEMLASNTELAARFGVSTLTADRAVRHLVKEGLVYRKQGVGTFITAQKHQRIKKSIRIGVADSEFPSTPLWDSAMGIRTRISFQYFYKNQCEAKLIDYVTVCDSDKLADAVHDLDGLLVSAQFLDNVTISNLQRLSIPIVVTNLEEIADLPFHEVVLDNRSGLREAAKKMMECPPEEVLIVYESHENGQNRKKIFENSICSLGYPEERIKSYRVETDALNNGVPSYRLGLQLCSEIKGKFLFSTSDVVSLSMLEAFREKGLNVGKDFQLLSYDNLEDYGSLSLNEPFLTTIDAPKVRWAERSAELLLEQIGKPQNETTIIRIPTKLVIRKTAF